MTRLNSMVVRVLERAMFIWADLGKYLQIKGSERGTIRFNECHYLISICPDLAQVYSELFRWSPSSSVFCLSPRIVWAIFAEGREMFGSSRQTRGDRV